MGTRSLAAPFATIIEILLRDLTKIRHTSRPFRRERDAGLAPTAPACDEPSDHSERAAGPMRPTLIPTQDPRDGPEVARTRPRTGRGRGRRSGRSARSGTHIGQVFADRIDMIQPGDRPLL